jgi:hypothetical protein
VLTAWKRKASARIARFWAMCALQAACVAGADAAGGCRVEAYDIIRGLLEGSIKPPAVCEWEALLRARSGENHIKAWKSHLAADRTSCHQAEANQFRLFLHAGAY